jgi:hypothetical protein
VLFLPEFKCLINQNLQRMYKISYFSSMKSNQIKLELLQWLKELQDKNTLQSLFHFKQIQESNDWWEGLTEKQKEEIELGMKQAKEGNTYSSSEVWKKYGRSPKD